MILNNPINKRKILCKNFKRDFIKASEYILTHLKNLLQNMMLIEMVFLIKMK